MTNDRSLEALRRESQQIWDQKARFWDEQMGEGNAFHTYLVAPAAERLLHIRPGEVVLDVACGNGIFARRLSELGAQVVATDFSPQFLERARARAGDHAQRIEYRLIDATDEAQLLTLGRQRFDAAVCNMALMDMPTIQPLLSTLTRLLRPGGRFVFSVQHPCFNTSAMRMVAEMEDRDGELVTTHAITITDYLHVPLQKGAGMKDEPAPHYSFHRPLSALLGACFEAGFVLDGLEEPAFPPQVSTKAILSWTNYTHIPPVLVARLRLSHQPGSAGGA